MPELRQLRVLRAVGELGSFSIAADELGYTQPAISKIVATLELEIGTRLVDRGTRPLRLTDAGEALSRRAASAFEQLAAAGRRASGATRALRRCPRSPRGSRT